MIRTDYIDAAAWQAEAVELARPWGGDGEFGALVHLVDERGQAPSRSRSARPPWRSST